MSPDFVPPGYKMKYQSPEHPVDCSSWKLDSDHAYMDGSKPKKAYYCPDTQLPFLISGRRYLLKRSRIKGKLQPGEPNPYAAQFWAEIIAYRVGCLAGVEVPPAFVATYNTQIGALIEWFHPDSATMTSGTDEIKKLTQDAHSSNSEKEQRKIFDSHHNLINLEKVFQKYAAFLKGNWAEHWCKIFLFDALIANNDRHHDNWGIIWSKTPGDSLASWTPAFDNGTSLGFEIQEADLANFSIERHTAKGCHHIRLNQESKKCFGHMELLNYFMRHFPLTGAIMKSCLAFSSTDLRKVVDELQKFQVPVPLSQARCDFIFRLIQYRRDKLLEIVTDEHYSACC